MNNSFYSIEVNLLLNHRVGFQQQYLYGEGRAVSLSLCLNNISVNNTVSKCPTI